MMIQPTRLNFFAHIAALVFVFTIFASHSNAQRRDYMTDAEIELVRDAQEIDRRIEVLTIAIDRRLEALQLAAAPNKLDEAWGDAPKGSRLELLMDVKRLLQKAIDDIDDVAAHKSRVFEERKLSDKEKKKESARFPTAFRQLAAAAQRYRAILGAQAEKVSDRMERAQVIDSIELCDQIIEAAAGQPIS